ncbi:MAG: hypothetical protein A2539_02635 [Elusimicrobia bacterium RIFOXYD2_FULL_34_15]|nr:MAG: hypothetical protein A2539_02635 [Elusimicrobia bacterium RIFOXYD2_FULL_34_15]
MPSIINNPPTSNFGGASKYAYEYTWDISNKASGVYIYLVRAHKAGEKTIKVLKKIALIK